MKAEGYGNLYVWCSESDLRILAGQTILEGVSQRDGLLLQAATREFSRQSERVFQNRTFSIGIRSLIQISKSEWEKNWGDPIVNFIQKKPGRKAFEKLTFAHKDKLC